MPKTTQKQRASVELRDWITGPDGEVRAEGRRVSARTLAMLGATAAVALQPLDRTMPSAWCFGYRRARDGMVSSSPAFRRAPVPGDLDEPCFRLGYVKGCKDAKRGKFYEPDYGVSHVSDYAEVGIRVAGTGTDLVLLTTTELLRVMQEESDK